MHPNAHHLELFYYVARYGGIAAALRHMPYQLDQSTISKQVRQLEVDIEIRLFEPGTYTCTVAGAELRDFLQPQCEGVTPLIERLKLTGRGWIVGSSEIVLAEYLPPVLATARRRSPDQEFGSLSGTEGTLGDALRQHRVQAAIVPMPEDLPPNIVGEVIAEIPLTLVVEKKIPSLEALLAAKKARKPWLYPCSVAAIPQHFAAGLETMKITWPKGMALSSLRVSEMVAAGLGPAVTLDLPNVALHPATHALPLPAFAPVKVGMLWHAPGGKIEQLVLTEVRKLVRKLWPG